MKRIAHILVLAVTLGAPVASALAQRQQSDDFAPPEPPPLTWSAWGLTAAFIAAVIILAAKNSKRTHLD